MQPSTLAKRGSLLLLALITVTYFLGLGQLPFVGPDEPRYAQIAREMWQRGDWITPTLGGHLWFEKPALLYWMMIGSYKLFGVSEFAARVPSALSGVLTVAAVFFAGRRIERRGKVESLAWNAAIVCASSLGLIVFARAASFDIVLTMTITWSLALFFAADLEENRKRRTIFLAGFYVFIGFSLLAKGFIGMVIPLGVAGAYYVSIRRLPDRLTMLSLTWGIPLALLVAASWYGPVIARNGWPFIDQFILKHQLQRYVANDYRHPGPFYYYIIVLPLLILPWLFFFLEAPFSWRLRRRERSTQLSIDERVVKFAWTWFLFPVAFFSFSHAKLPAYVLPVLPAVALLIAHRIVRRDQLLKGSGWFVRLTAGLFVLAALSVGFFGSRLGAMPWSCIAAIAAIPGVAGVAAFLLTRRRSVVAVFALATTTVALVALQCGASQFADRESSRRLIEMANARGYGNTPIYGLMPDDRTPEFYAAGRVIYHASGEPEMYIGPPQLVNETLRRRETLLAFIPANDVANLSSAHAATTEFIGDNGRHALVAVHPKTVNSER